MTQSNLSIHGIYRDVIENPRQGIVHDSGWVSNTIVTRCRELLAAFMNDGPASGIHHLAVGQGDAAWDSGDIPAPTPEDTGLLQAHTPPIYKADLPVVYLTAAGGEQNDPPTPRLQITATLAPGYPPPPAGSATYPLREFGLFGWFGDQATGEAYMINSVRHQAIHKGADDTLIRVLRLQF